MLPSMAPSTFLPSLLSSSLIPEAPPQHFARSLRASSCCLAVSRASTKTIAVGDSAGIQVAARYSAQRGQGSWLGPRKRCSLSGQLSRSQERTWPAGEGGVTMQMSRLDAAQGWQSGLAAGRAGPTFPRSTSGCHEASGDSHTARLRITPL